MHILSPLLFLFTPHRLLVTFGAAFFVFLLISVLGNPLIFWEFFQYIPQYGVLSIKLFFLLVWGSYAGMTSLSLSMLLAFLFALNLVLILSNKRWRYFKNQKLGMAGILTGALGIGCAACGTLLTGTFISMFGLSFVTATLPFQSLFFQLVSVFLLLISIGLLLREMVRDPSCPVPVKNSRSALKKIGISALLLLAIALFFLWQVRETVGLLLIREGRLVALAVAINPQDPGVRFVAGNHFFSGESYDIERAKQYYLSTIALDERFPGAHYQLSRIYFIEGRFGDALNEINKELEYYPDYKRSYYIRGLVYGYMEWYELAAADFEEFLRFRPESWAGHNDLAWIYFQRGDYQKVAAVTENGLKYSPDNVWLLNSRGVALLNLGRKDEAKEMFERALGRAETMQPSDWGIAYPGNNPDIYPEGLAAMQSSIRNNLKLLE